MAIIDQNVLNNFFLEICGGDRDLLEELATDCSQDARQLAATIKTSLSANDLEPLRRSAHSLKSTSATFGAMALSDSARSLESLTQNEASLDANRSKVESLAKDIETGTEEFAQTLEKIGELV